MIIKKAPYWESPDGRIELYCGDCLKVMRVFEPDLVDMVCCDLPYGTTRNKWDSIIPLDELWCHYSRILNPNKLVCLTAQTPFDKVLGVSNLNQLRYEWIWKKEAGTGFLNAKKMPLKSHENILVFGCPGIPYNPQMRQGTPYPAKRGRKSSNYGDDTNTFIDKGNTGERYPLSILEFSRDKLKIHPTQKPVALMEYLIKTYSNEDDRILDNCMGSGTTGVACVRTNRRFIGIEKDPVYFEAAKQRIMDELKEVKK